VIGKISRKSDDVMIVDTTWRLEINKGRSLLDRCTNAFKTRYLTPLDLRVKVPDYRTLYNFLMYETMIRVE
jgi:hypothetical protein